MLLIGMIQMDFFTQLTAGKGLIFILFFLLSKKKIMKNILLVLLITLSSLNLRSEIHVITVWDGYMQFLPSSLNIELGDTIHFLPLDFPTMMHTITSSNIPLGALSFDQTWQAPSDTFFQLIPQVEGLYEYVCTPHIPMGMIGSFNVINTGTPILESHKNKKIIQRINLIGGVTKVRLNEPSFLIYDDGTVEKSIIIDYR